MSRRRKPQGVEAEEGFAAIVHEGRAHEGHDDALDEDDQEGELAAGADAENLLFGQGTVMPILVVLAQYLRHLRHVADQAGGIPTRGNWLLRRNLNAVGAYLHTVGLEFNGHARGRLVDRGVRVSLPRLALGPCKV